MERNECERPVCMGWWHWVVGGRAQPYHCLLAGPERDRESESLCMFFENKNIWKKSHIARERKARVFARGTVGLRAAENKLQTRERALTYVCFSCFGLVSVLGQHRWAPLAEATLSMCELHTRPHAALSRTTSYIRRGGKQRD